MPDPPPFNDADQDRQAAKDPSSSGHAEHWRFLLALAAKIHVQAHRCDDRGLLATAVDLYRQALDLSLVGHPARSRLLYNLASALHTQFAQGGDLETLAEAVGLHRQALDLRPPGHPDRSSSLNDLATVLTTRFDQFGDLETLTEAIELRRQALVDPHPPGRPDRSGLLNNLASALQSRFAHIRDMDSLTEAIALNRQALHLNSPDHSNRSISLSNLAISLTSRFLQLGDLIALAEAVELHRKALDLHPPGHPNRSNLLNNLADVLRMHSEQFGDLEPLTEAIDLQRQALDLRQPGHPDRPGSLSSLGITLTTRYSLIGDLDLLNEATDMFRHALDLRLPGHPLRSNSLNDLANALRARFERLSDEVSLAEAIDLHRQALQLCPYPDHRRPSWLASLGIALAARSKVAQSLVSDRDEAFDLAREGLQLCDNGHPMRMHFLFTVGQCMLHPGTRVFDFEDGIHHILEALRDKTLPAGQCLREAIRVLRTLEAACQPSTPQNSTLEFMRPDCDDKILQVYVSVIRLLPRAASFGLNHAGRLHVLSTAETISRDAATRAIQAGRNTEAIEMLEEGRGVFWSQALRLRATNLDILAAQEAQELRTLFQTLELGSARGDSMSTIQRERHVEERRRLSDAAEALIADIRSRPSMSRFLMPPAFSSLVQSLPETGFVVVLVASKLGHHALVLDRTKTAAMSIRLNPPERGFFSEAVRGALPRDGGSRPPPEDVSRAFGISKKARKSPKEPFEEMLVQLWTLIVKPVIDLLSLKVCSTNNSHAAC
jgi:tetratricopeptide (TPR) repeat protein